MAVVIDLDQVLAVAMRKMRQGKAAPAQDDAPGVAAVAFDWDDINTKAAVFMHSYSHCTHQPKPPAPARSPVPDGVAGDMAAAAADAWPSPTCATCVHFQGSLPPSVRAPAQDDNEEDPPRHFGLCENAVQARLDWKVHRQPIGASIWAAPRGCKGYIPIRPVANLPQT